jgi:hypothetical protein
MSENPGITTDSTIGPPIVHDVDHRDRRLRRVLMWVGIVAGIVFIVAVVFFSGFALGRGSGGHHGWHRGYQGQMGPGGGTNGCPMMRDGGMGSRGTGPGGMMGPGMDPDELGPGMMRPNQSPVSPSAAPAPR